MWLLAPSFGFTALVVPLGLFAEAVVPAGVGCIVGLTVVPSKTTPALPMLITWPPVVAAEPPAVIVVDPITRVRAPL